MTNEELVKALRGLANGIWKNSEYTWFGGEEKVFADAAAAIEALEAEVNRPITLEQAIDRLHELGWLQEHDRILTEPKRGEWKPFDLTWGRSIYNCTVCGESADVPTANGKALYNFCPNCGAKMEVQE